MNKVDSKQRQRRGEEQRPRWPTKDLEYLESCPACGGMNNAPLFEDLIDGIFGVPGRWTMHRCRHCSAAFLNPRPTESSIHRAYEHYYTHSSTSEGPSRKRVSVSERILTRLRGIYDAILRRGYLNRRYGYSFPRALSADVLIGGSVRRRKFRNRTDHWIRHLPAPVPRKAELLDIGCGNGDFIRVATELGFKASGIDLDSDAVDIARNAGFDVKVASLPGSGLTPMSFEHICLSHVLEHLHRPGAALEEAHRLLRPGGRLWLTQPNLDSLGLERFGANWRGLEPPRHLTLYNADGLRRLLTLAGFVDIVHLPAEEAAEFYYLQSARMSEGLNPYTAPHPSNWESEIKPAALAADAASFAAPEIAESLTFIAFKPAC